MLDFKLLTGFLSISERGSITRAAEELHITQSALSRQLAQLEADVGAQLVVRGKRGVELTQEGLALRRRAREIVDLVAIAEAEVATSGGDLEGHLTLGAGELTSMSAVMRIVRAFCEAHPRVAFGQFTGTADQVAERLDRGLLDFGVFLEPVSVERYDYIALPGEERWVVLVRSDDPLAGSGAVDPQDLRGRDLIVPDRLAKPGVLARWLGVPVGDLRVRATVNIGNNGCVMVQEGMGALVCVEGSASFADPARFACLPLNGVSLGSTILAWKRGTPPTRVAQAFASHVQRECGV